MRRTFSIAKREYLASVRTKGFIMGLVLGPIMMCGSLIALVALKDQVNVKDQRVAVVDRAGGFAPVLIEAARVRNTQDVFNVKTGKKVKPAYLLEVVQPSAGEDLQALRLRLSEQVRQGGLHAFLDIGPQVVHPGTNQENSRIAYHSKSSALDDLRRWLEQPLNTQLRKVRLAEAGLEETKVKDLFNWAQVEGMSLLSADTQTGQVQKAKKTSELEAVGIPVAAVILLWVIVMMGGMPLLQAVMEEKSLRIAEVLLGCVTPFELMLGKLLGGVGVALTGSVVYLGGAAFGLMQAGMFGYFPFELVPWFVMYAIAAIAIVGTISAALGSACADAKDAQNLAMFALLPVLVPMFMLGPLLKEPNSAFAVGASFFPPFTPMIMLLRQSMPGGVPWWQPVVGLVGMVLFAWLLVYGGSRVFRVGILMQGKAPKLAEIVKWAFRG